MKKYFLLALLFLCSIFVTPTFAQEYVEYISEFKSDITVNEDATLDIVEEIHYILPNDGRHGIFWQLPVDYSVYGFKRATGFKLNNLYYYSPLNPDAKYTSYEKTESNGWVELKIGDAYSTISGEYVYVINYTLTDVGFSYFDDHDELYLNIIGPGWQAPILSSTATIHTPNTHTKTVCYTGPEGSSSSNCTILDSGNTLSVSTDNILSPYDAFTFAISYPVGTFENHQKNIWLGILIANLGILIPIPVIILLARKLKKSWKNEKITVIPHYESPDDIDPFLAGFVYLSRFDSKHLSALIIWMATKGYITIEKDKKKTYINKGNVDLGNIDENYVLQLYEGMFKSSDRVDVSNMPTSFTNKIGSVSSSVSVVAKSNGYIDSKRITDKSILSVSGIVLTFFTISTLFPIFTMYAAIGTAFGIVISGIAMFIISLQVDIKSVSGNELYYQLLGLKMYIDTAEKHRIEFHDNPEKYRGVFEKLLPYAIIFGLEKKWAKEFEDLYQDTQPDWYRGNMDAFDVYMISRAVTNLNSGIRTATSKMYGSSSGYRSSGWSSGGSGFSGGSSGGGGGGSGGGSW